MILGIHTTKDGTLNKSTHFIDILEIHLIQLMLENQKTLGFGLLFSGLGYKMFMQDGSQQLDLFGIEDIELMTHSNYISCLLHHYSCINLHILILVSKY